MTDARTTTGVETVLQRFGWEATPEFVRRYYTDVWVYNLANALAGLEDENGRLRKALRTAEGGHSD